MAFDHDLQSLPPAGLLSLTNEDASVKVVIVGRWRHARSRVGEAEEHGAEIEVGNSHPFDANGVAARAWDILPPSAAQPAVEVEARAIVGGVEYAA